jgi:hypothetical protein
VRLVQVGGEHLRDGGDGFAKVLAEGVEQGQLGGAAGAVAPAAAVVAGDRREHQPLGQRDRFREVGAVAELGGQLALLEQLQRQLDRLAGDVLARHPLAEALGAVVEDAADDDVVGLGARVRGVPDRLLQRDPHLPGSQLSHAHANGPRRVLAGYG